ncbi:MAG: flagellar export chaperone FliS [Angelakisella sp.]|nr:flagellar export chaperone FliS [Angelakisella sp.]
MPVNPYEQYRQQSIMTMTQGEILIKLYEEIVKQLSSAVIHIQKKDYFLSNQSLQKSQRILGYLTSTLDTKYDVSENLALLYDFFNQNIIDANIKKDPAILEEIIPMVSELRDTFAQADRLSRIK